MARQIKSIIELTGSQTKEFLASLQNPKRNENRERMLKKAQKTKFNVVL